MKREPPVSRTPTAPHERQPSKSPPRKLVKFFAQRREQWQEQGRAATARLKPLKKKRQRGEERQPRWQSRGQTVEGACARLRAAQPALAEAGEAGEKKARGAG